MSSSVRFGPHSTSRIRGSKEPAASLAFVDQFAHADCMPFRFAEDHSTLTGGNVLARREAETAEISDRASHLPANGTPVGLGAVFDNDQIVAPGPCRIENAQRKAGRFAYFISSGKR